MKHCISKLTDKVSMDNAKTKQTELHLLKHVLTYSTIIGEALLRESSLKIFVKSDEYMKCNAIFTKCSFVKLCTLLFRWLPQGGDCVQVEKELS